MSAALPDSRRVYPDERGLDWAGLRFPRRAADYKLQSRLSKTAQV